MIRVVCDKCNGPINLDADRWYGVDFTEALPPPEPIVIGPGVDFKYEPLTILRSIPGDHMHHFCSARCLTYWSYEEENSRCRPL